MIALKLSKAGYGRPDEIMLMNSEVVMSAIEYESFLQDYERAFLELNKDIR